MAKEIIDNPFLHRYCPNMRFTIGGFSDKPSIRQTVTYHGDSITDKESYRLNLASARGAISSLTENQNKGWYMFEDGKYDPHKDFSYIMRKDLSIVEIDEYTQRLKEQLLEADKSLKKDIESQIAQLEAKKKEKESVIVEQHKENSQE